MKRVWLLLLVLAVTACGGSSPSGPTSFTPPPTPVPTATPTPAPLWHLEGSGDNVFDMPTSVRRVKITGDYTKNSSNFIIWISNRLVVNELIGTGWGTTHFEGTYAVSGGQTEIKNSSGVAWTFAEVR